MKRGYLILENGQYFRGELFGYTNVGEDDGITGEIVFQTGMVGYTESLTDPSYKEQILVYTYPIIGNYGVPKDTKDEYGLSEVFESDRIHVSALVVQEIVDKHSHWQSEMSLSEWLEKERVIGISGIDTRELTKNIREYGTMKARIINTPVMTDTILKQPIVYEAINLVKKYQKRTFSPSVWRTDETDEETDDEEGSYVREVSFFKGHHDICIMDCGIKNSQIRIILNKVKEHNALNPNDTFTVIITPLVPYKNYIFIDCCEGLFISNGPGDPRVECLEPLVELIKNMWQMNRMYLVFAWDIN